LGCPPPTSPHTPTPTHRPPTHRPPPCREYYPDPASPSFPFDGAPAVDVAATIYGVLNRTLMEGLPQVSSTWEVVGAQIIGIFGAWASQVLALGEHCYCACSCPSTRHVWGVGQPGPGAGCALLLCLLVPRSLP
jgi:hypothetical protein